MSDTNSGENGELMALLQVVIGSVITCRQAGDGLVITKRITLFSLSHNQKDYIMTIPTHTEPALHHRSGVRVVDDCDFFQHVHLLYNKRSHGGLRSIQVSNTWCRSHKML